MTSKPLLAMALLAALLGGCSGGGKGSSKPGLAANTSPEGQRSVAQPAPSGEPVAAKPEDCVQTVEQPNATPPLPCKQEPSRQLHSNAP
jgi:hypothetical protein